MHAAPIATDHALLATFIGGDRGSFDELVVRHQGLVQAACRRQLSAADADDAVQAVFLILARKPEQAAGCPSVEAWLLRTARNVALTAVRARGRRARAEQESLVHAPPPTTPAEEAELLPLLDRCLDELPAKERMAIAMHYLAGRSHDEVAAALDCPKGTVYSHLSRGLARLRGKLARRGAAVTATALLTLLSGQAHAAATPLALGTVLAAPSAAAHTLASATTTRLLMHQLLLPISAALVAGGIATALVLPDGQPPAPPSAEQVPAPAVPPPVVPAAAAPAPLAALPADTRVVLRLHDQARAAGRWAASPYPALLATPWGTGFAGETAKQPGPFLLLAQLAGAQTATLGIVPVDGRPVGHVLATVAAGVPFAIPEVDVVTAGSDARATVPLDRYRLDGVLRTRGPGIDGGLRFRWDELLPLPTGTIAAAVAPAADSEAAWKAVVPGAAEGVLATVEWTIEPFGLRERLRLAGIPVPPSDKKPHAVDRAVFAGLPPTTLWALATIHPLEIAGQVPGFDPAIVDRFAADAGIADWEALRGQVGPALLWAEQGAPLPAISFSLAMPQVLGEAALALLDAKLQFSPGADGVHLGVAGFIPVQAAWRDGQLLVTTASGGIAAAAARPGGFTAVPEVAAALTELPAGDLLAAGLGRSGPSWGALASLAPWLTRRKPELATLGADLTKAGKHGFLAVRRDGADVAIDAGGLLGGPLSTAAITGAFFRMSAGERRPPRAERQERQAPPPAEAPKTVEF